MRKGPHRSADRSRGFALIEICFALTIFVIVIGGACMVLNVSGRHAALQWDDLAAREYADSVVEHMLAQTACPTTGESGQKIGGAPGDPMVPPGLSATVCVIKNSSDQNLVDVRVVVESPRDINAMTDPAARVERTIRRRAQR